MLLAKLSNGRTVVGKVSDGRVTPKTYANRTQAARAAAQIGGEVLKGFGRPWYVAPATKPCLICQQPSVTEFFCPCDLHHGLCAIHSTIERKDCAFAHLYKEAM